MDSQSALKQLNDYRATTQGAGDIYKQQSDQLGVGASQQRAQELRNLVSGTEQALRGVESSVTGRTQGSLVTEAQRSRLANIERAPIADQFNTQQGALSNEQQTYQNLLGEAGNRAGLVYGSQQDRLKGLESGYQTALDTEYKQRQEALQREQMAQQQRQFEEQLAVTKAGAQKNTYDVQALINQILGKTTSNTAARPPLSSILGTGLGVTMSSGSSIPLSVAPSQPTSPLRVTTATPPRLMGVTTATPGRITGVR